MIFIFLVTAAEIKVKSSFSGFQPFQAKSTIIFSLPFVQVSFPSVGLVQGFYDKVDFWLLKASRLRLNSSSLVFTCSYMIFLFNFDWFIFRLFLDSFKLDLIFFCFLVFLLFSVVRSSIQIIYTKYYKLFLLSNLLRLNLRKFHETNLLSVVVIVHS